MPWPLTAGAPPLWPCRSGNLLLEVHNVSKEYASQGGLLSVLSGVSFSLRRGDAAAIMGPSGSGKSTLLHVIGALDPPTAGTVTLDGCDPFALGEKQQAAFRNRNVGFVFQDHCLLPQCTVLENVLVPSLIAEKNAGVDFEARARALLEQVGLAARLYHLPGELSGGERQRVSLARALIRQPLLLLCDEPTGNLDRRSAEGVAELLVELHREQKTILLVVTHSGELAHRLPQRFELENCSLRPA